MRIPTKAEHKAFEVMKGICKAQHVYGSLFGYAMHKLNGNYDENGDMIGG